VGARAWRDVSDERADVDGTEPANGLIPAWFADLAQEVAGDLLRLGAWGAEHMLEFADRLTTVRARRGDFAARRRPAALVPLAPAHGLPRLAGAEIVAERAERDPNLRQFFTIFDTIASTAAGIVDDGARSRLGRDQRRGVGEWLRRHAIRRSRWANPPSERPSCARSTTSPSATRRRHLEGERRRGTATNDLLGCCSAIAAP
jgi:hypothetical protein